MEPLAALFPRTRRSGALTLEDEGSNAIDLTPTFVSGTSQYSVFVSNAIDSMTLTATTTDVGATVVIEGDDDTATTDVATLDFNVGLNMLTVTVTAEDDTDGTYTVTVIRAAAAPVQDPNAVWTANLTVESGLVNSYLWVGYDSLAIGALAPNSFSLGGSTFTVTQFALDPGSSVMGSPPLNFIAPEKLHAGKYILHVGSKSFNIIHNGYEHFRIDDPGLDWEAGDVVLVKLFSETTRVDNADLKSLKVGSNTLGFNRDRTAYSVTVHDNIYEAVMRWQAFNSNVTVVISGAPDSFEGNQLVWGANDFVALYPALGANTYTLTVTAKDGMTTKTYTVTVNRGFGCFTNCAGNANLLAFWVKDADGDFVLPTPGFNPQRLSYWGAVGDGVVTLKARPAHSGATLKMRVEPFLNIHSGKVLSVKQRTGDVGIEGTLQVPKGRSRFAVDVTSEDGTTTRTYKYGIERDGPFESVVVTPDGGSPAPLIAPGIRGVSYLATVPADTTTVNVSVVAGKTLYYSTVTVGGHTGVEYAGQIDEAQISLEQMGPTSPTIVVDGPSYSVFRFLIIQREDSSQATEAEPLTAAFQDAPSVHDGSSAFTTVLAFSEAADIDGAGLLGTLDVSGGTVTDVQAVSGSDVQWTVTITPDGTDAVTVTLSPTTLECDAAGAICTADGRKLSQGLALLVAYIPQTAQQQTLEPLTAAFQDAPSVHDGSSAFTTVLAFSEAADIDGAGLLGTLDVSGGTVTDVQAVSGSDVQWTVTITPDGTDAVTVTLSPTTLECDAAGAICTADGRKLSQGLALLVAYIPQTAQQQTLEPLTAAFQDAPSVHDGSSAFTTVLAFSEAADIDGAGFLGTLDVSGGTVTDVQAVSGSDVQWTVTITPDGTDAVTVTLSPTTSGCDAAGAICTADGRKLSNAPSATIQGPPPLTASFEDVPAEHDGSTVFTVELAFSAEPQAGIQRIENALVVSGGTLQRARRVTPPNNDRWTVTIEPDGGQAVTVTLPATTSECDAADAICTAGGSKLSNAPSATIDAPPPVTLTASLENAATSHNGTDAFTFELRFSEDVRLSYKTLRDHSLAVTGGTVTKAKRLEQGSNIGWRITVVPDGNAAVTIVLPVTTDCNATGAICTRDDSDRPLSNRLELTVSGPGQ